MLNKSLNQSIAKAEPGCFHMFFKGSEFNYLLLIDVSGKASKGFRDPNSFYERIFIKKIYPAISFNDLEIMGRYKVLINKDQNAGIQDLVKEIARDKIKNIKDLSYEHEVSVSIKHLRLGGVSAVIDVVIRRYGTDDFCKIVLAHLATIKPMVSEIIGSKQIEFRVNGQPYPSVYNHSFYSVDEDGEDDNPNWPSKTGNISGGGRGNNPPKK